MKFVVTLLFFFMTFFYVSRYLFPPSQIFANMTKPFSQNISSESMVGSGNVITEYRDIGPFNEIAIHGEQVHVLVNRGKPGVSIRSDEAFMEDISTYVDNGKLIIEQKKFFVSPREMHIVVTAEKLNALYTYSATNILVEDILTDNFTLEVHGVGVVTLSGNAEVFDATLYSSSTVKAKDFLATHVNAEVIGSGILEVSAMNFLNARVSGSGLLNYYGYPKVTKAEITGTGNIKHID